MSTAEERPPAEITEDKPKRRFWQGQGGSLAVNLVLVAAIILSVLWLPPISLQKRFTKDDYTAIGEQAWSVADADGAQFTVLPEGLQGSLRARLTSVPLGAAPIRPQTPPTGNASTACRNTFGSPTHSRVNAAPPPVIS